MPNNINANITLMPNEYQCRNIPNMLYLIMKNYIKIKHTNVKIYKCQKNKFGNTRINKYKWHQTQLRHINTTKTPTPKKYKAC